MSSKVDNGGWILEQGGDSDKVLSLGKRFDPFSDIFKGIEDLTNIEVGNFPIVPDESIVNIVDKAIASLESEEQDIIRAVFFQGFSISQLAETMKTEYHLVRWKKERAVKKIHIFLSKHYFKLSDSEVHSDCPLCTFDKYNMLNVFIHLWYDTKKGSLRGITKEIRKLFGSALADQLSNNPRLIELHIDAHMGVGKAGRRRVNKYKQEDESKDIALFVSDNLKTRLVEIADKQGLTVDQVVYGVIKLGLPIYEELIYRGNKKEINKLLKEI